MEDGWRFLKGRLSAGLRCCMKTCVPRFRTRGRSSIVLLAISFFAGISHAQPRLQAAGGGDGGLGSPAISDGSPPAGDPPASLVVAPPPTTTIITHGFSGDATPGHHWQIDMGKAIRARHLALGGSGGVWLYSPSTGRWVLQEGTNASQCIVLVFDWAAESDLVQTGPNLNFAQAGADALYAALRTPSGNSFPVADLLTGRKLHLIGHSRGASVNSELARRLIAAGHQVNHVTTLDPHPVTQSGTPYPSPEWGDPIPTTWQGVQWADNYWREDLDPADFNGMSLNGSTNRQLDEGMLGHPQQTSGYATEHSDVHLWYHGTIDTTCNSNCADGKDITTWMRLNWWPPFASCPGPSFNSSDTGYFFFLNTLMGGQYPCQLPSGNHPTPTAPPLLFGGDFASSSWAGWKYHGGGGDGNILGQYLTLGADLPAAASSLTHNRLYVPADTERLVYDYNVSNAGTEERLYVELVDRENDNISWQIEQFPLTQATNGWIVGHSVTLPTWVPRGGTFRLRFRATWDVAANATVHIDNVRLERSAAPSSINVSITQLSPNPAAPGESVTIAGTAMYNTGAPVGSGTAMIATGGVQWTAPLSPSGSFSRIISAPSSSQNVTVTVTVGNATGSTSQFLSITPPGGGSGYEFVESLTCRSVSSTTGLPSGVRPAFACTDSRMYVWTELRDITASNLWVRWRFYSPGGQHWYTTDSVSGPVWPGPSYFSWWIDVQGGNMGQWEGLWRVDTQVRTGTSWVTRASNSFAIQYSLGQYLMAQGFTGAPNYLPVNPTNTFYQDQPAVWTWSELRLVRPVLSLRWKFFEPAGGLFHQFDSLTDSPTNEWWDTYRLGVYLDIAGTQAANKCGRWRVEMYSANCGGTYELVYTDNFQLMERPSLSPVATAAQVGGTPLPGQVVTLQGSATDNTYLDVVELWYNDGAWQSLTLAAGINNAEFSQQCQIGPFQAGTVVHYYAKARDTSGNEATSAVQSFQVNDPCVAPVLTQHPTNQNSCAGPGSVSFVVSATGTPLLSYQWRKNQHDIQGATGVSLAISPVTPADAGVYDCRVTNSCGSTTSNSATLTVSPPPTFSQHPQPQTVCEGASVSFNVNASNASTFQWRRNGANLSNVPPFSGAHTPTLSISAASAGYPPNMGQAGTYDCVVSGCGSATSNGANLQVNRAPVIVHHPTTQSVLPGQPASFSVAASVSGAATYQWRRNGINIADGGTVSGATTSTITCSAAEVRDAGRYSCAVSNGCGTAYSHDAFLVVAGQSCATIWRNSIGMPGVNARVQRICSLPNGDVIVGGEFTSGGGVALGHIGRWNGADWQSLGSGLDGVAVLDIVMRSGTSLVAGGHFWTAGGQTASNIAQWDGTAWAPLGDGLNAEVWALTTLPNGNLVAAGNFTNAGLMHVGCWNGSAWSPLGSGFDEGSFVLSLTTLTNGDVVAGGGFAAVGGNAASNIARWNGTSWLALGSGLDGMVWALEVLPNGDLVAGGAFTTIGGGTPTNHVAKWDGASWSALGQGVSNGQFNSIVTALETQGNGDLIAGGYFSIAGGAEAKGVARWNGTEWAPLGAGIGREGFPAGFVFAIECLPNGETAVGGEYTSAGGAAANNLAVWGCSECYANCDESTGSPPLTANDFQCFINKFAAGDPYANCDGSTGTPALTANDFQCFINQYAFGCP